MRGGASELRSRSTDRRRDTEAEGTLAKSKVATFKQMRGGNLQP